MQATDNSRETLERMTQLLERSITPAEIAGRVDLVVDNDHALYLERRRRTIIAAAGAYLAAGPGEDAYPIAAVSDEMRDWLRDTVPQLVCDAAEPRLRAEWRVERERARGAGENVAAAVGLRSWDDSAANGLSLLVADLCGYLLSAMDWHAYAQEQLAADENGVQVAHLAQTLAAIRRAEMGPHADPTGTGVAEEIVRLELRELTGTEACLTSEELAERVHYLSELRLAGSRFVGGTSGTLVHT